MKLKKILAAGLAVMTLGLAVPFQPVQKMIDEVSLTASADPASVTSGNCGKSTNNGGEESVKWALYEIFDENGNNVKVTVNGQEKTLLNSP